MLVVKLYKNFRPCATGPAKLTKLTSAAAASIVMPRDNFLSLANIEGNNNKRVSYSIALV